MNSLKILHIFTGPALGRVSAPVEPGRAGKSPAQTNKTGPGGGPFLPAAHSVHSVKAGLLRPVSRRARLIPGAFGRRPHPLPAAVVPESAVAVVFRRLAAVIRSRPSAAGFAALPGFFMDRITRAVFLPALLPVTAYRARPSGRLRAVPVRFRLPIFSRL